MIFTARSSPAGCCRCPRWYTDDKHRGELYRLIAIAAERFAAHGRAGGRPAASCYRGQRRQDRDGDQPP